MTKHLHPGKAVLDGLLAALLAEQGFTGAKKNLEGDKGFFRPMAEESLPSRVTESLGQDYRILGNSYQVYPSCRHTHSGVDLALKLSSGGLEPDRIREIEIGTLPPCGEPGG